ncbi:MAG: C25 family cysteine peptidase [Candidatus Zixiibacteriota bacterium]
MDYIILCHEALNGDALQQFLDLKEDLGLSYKLEFVYDGLWTDSLQGFVRAIYDATEYAPLHVLLIGSAKSDPGFDTCQCDKYANSASNNLVPTAFDYDLYENRRGYDQWYSWIEPQSYVRRSPDLIVGRIPARSEAELQAYVDKLVEYVSDTADAAWKRSVLLLAGDRDRGPLPDFPSPNGVTHTIDLLDDSLPAEVSTTVIRYSDYADGGTRKDAFVNAIDLGQGLILSLATGSNVGNLAYIIERASFDAAVDLTNSGMYPVMLSLSCDLAMIDTDVAPGMESLAENLLFAPSAGAIGIAGPAGFSSDISNFAFAEEARRQLYDRGIMRLGNLTFATAGILKREGRGPTDTYDLMTVLGDPGLEIDLGSLNDQQPTIRSGFEMTDPLPFQNRPFVVGADLDSVMTGVVKSRPVWGRRAYCLEGRDYIGTDPKGLWTVYDDLGITIDSSTRFLTFYVRAVEHPESIGRFSIDFRLGNGELLSECTGCAPGIADQYGNSIAPLWRGAPLGEKRFFAFDLSAAYGQTVDKLLVGYDAWDPASTGRFKAYFDDVGLSPTWGQAPEIGQIEMPANVYTNSVSNVSISADDPDILPFDDYLSVVWSASAGTITGNGFQVQYHAPGFGVLDVLIKAKITDMGGHVDSSMKTIGVFPPGGGGGCPHLELWNGMDFVDQGAILTRSRIGLGNSVTNDALPVPVQINSGAESIRFRLREDGSDVSTLDQVSLFLVSDSLHQTSDRGMTATGEIVRGEIGIPPVYCRDDQGFDQRDKVVTRDGNSFRAYGPGYLILSYRDLNDVVLGKPSLVLAEGGGNGIDPPPKDIYKVTAQELTGVQDPPEEPNYVTVSAYSPSGQWTEVERLAPQSRFVLPQLVNLLPYVDSTGYLLVKIAWTWSFSADDLSFYRFSREGIPNAAASLTGARHSQLGDVTRVLARSDGTTATLEPGEVIDLEFSIPQATDYDLAVMRFRGKYEAFDPTRRRGGAGAAEDEAEEPVLNQNTPNPFNATTQFSYSLPHAGDVELVVYNVLGQPVRTLVNGPNAAGVHAIEWDGRSDQGEPLATGVYLYTLKFEGALKSRKMTLLK